MENKTSYLAAVPLDTRQIAQARLNIEKKQRSNLLAWNGQFSPQLIETLLEHYAKPDYRVLDPFMGSGTLLHECGRLKIEVTGCDINPAAYSLAKTYELINVPSDSRAKEIAQFEKDVLPLKYSNSPLFRGTEGARDSFLGARDSFLAGQTKTLSNTQRLLFDALTILLNVNEQERLTQDRLFSAWDKLRSVIEVLPYSSKPVTPLNVDARQLPLNDATIDLVITSPPYINVFNYHQQYRGSAETLGWNLLDVARSEIGSNRKHRGNRFLTVIQYCLDIMQTLGELRRVCRANARVIFVVGRESRVRGKAFYNGEIVAQVATLCTGYRLITRQERVFTNRFGARIFEDILHFTTEETAKRQSKDVRAVACKFLDAALETSAAEVAADITSAISQANTVMPSPLFNKGTGFSRSELTDACTTTSR